MLDLISRYFNKSNFITTILLTFLFAPHITCAESTNISNWQLDAETINNLPDDDGLIATGDIVLTNGGQTINGDWLSYDKPNQVIKIKGFTTLNNKSYTDLYINPLGEPKSINLYNIAAINSWQISTSDLPAKAPEIEDKTILITTDKTVLDPEKDEKINILVASDNQTDTAKSTAPEQNQKQKTTKNKTTKEKDISTEEWDITADKISRYDNPSNIIAEGNVVLIKKELIPPQPSTLNKVVNENWSDLLGEGTEEIETPVITQETATQKPQYRTVATIYTDWLSYDIENGIIKAIGNIRVDGEDSQIIATKATISANDETGTFQNATMRQADLMYMEGEEISKTGPETFNIVDGWVITCKLEDGQEPPWAIVSAETNVTKNGYATLKHARFHVEGVPIFYTPYLILPVNETRQTGFLFPEVSESTNKGVGINTPFFWAISENTDATFHPQYYSERGFMPGAEFRYVASAKDKGSLDVTYLSDQQSSSESNYTYQDSDRFWLRGKVDHTFGDNWLARVDLDYASDKDFLREFNSGINSLDSNQDLYMENYGRGFSDEDETQRESSITILRAWNSSFLEINLLAINDLRTDAFGNKLETDNPFWKLPSIGYSGTYGLPIDALPVNFNWDTEYVNFWREDGYGGHRVNINPSFSAGLPISPYLESSAEFGIHETFYMVEEYGNPVGTDMWTDSDDQKNRLMYEFELEIATSLERDYCSSNNRYTHLLRPFVRYNFVPEEDQSDLPYFDEDDRIDEENGITYGFDTYINMSELSYGGSTSNNQTLHLEVYQTYRLADLNTYNDDTGALELEEDEFSDLTFKLKWTPFRNVYVSYKTEYNMYGESFTEHTFAGSVKTDTGHSARIEYNYDEYTLEELNGYFRYRLSNTWEAELDIEHSLYDDETHDLELGLTYLQPCWSVTLGYEYTPDDESVTALFTLANIGANIGVGKSGI